jgi:restriction system protein
MSRKKQAEFVKWFGPLLDALRDLGDSGRPREVSGRIAKNLNLPDQVLDETLKSGGSKFHNQVAWARQYLVWEGLLDSSKHGTWTLTEKGRKTHVTESQAREIFKKWVAIHAENRKQKSAEDLDFQDADEEIPASEGPSTDEKLSLISVLRSLRRFAKFSIPAKILD